MAMANKSYTLEQRTAANSGTWTDSANVPAAPNNRLVQVTNSISGGTQFFRVRVGGSSVANGLRILSVEALDSNRLRFSFTAEADRTYTIEFRDLLTAGAWERLMDVSAALSNGVTQITVPASTVPMRFYRLRTPQAP